MGSLVFAVLLIAAEARVTVDAARGHALGPARAPVTIVEFADFLCPYCAELAPTLRSVAAAYGDRVRLVFREFPVHPHAVELAAAAECAAEQGRFWPMHDRLFAERRPLDSPAIGRLARAAGVDGDELDRCRASQPVRRRIERDLADGLHYGVQATPTLFVNGRALVGAQTLAALTAVIDEELRHAQEEERHE